MCFTSAARSWSPGGTRTYRRWRPTKTPNCSGITAIPGGWSRTRSSSGDQLCKRWRRRAPPAGRPRRRRPSRPRWSACAGEPRGTVAGAAGRARAPPRARRPGTGSASGAASGCPRTWGAGCSAGRAGGAAATASSATSSTTRSRSRRRPPAWTADATTGVAPAGTGLKETLVGAAAVGGPDPPGQTGASGSTTSTAMTTSITVTTSATTSTAMATSTTATTSTATTTGATRT
mmetsp:Transcript_59815/g.157253  ORF Transcript_59815/g.157253 Transcript_59815/m.157253 type:complete len:233 (+) Transcript_59815:859-1557(+)